MPTPRSPHNADVLAHLGQQLRQIREAAGHSQGGLRHYRQGQPRPLRQATVSHIENGHDVTLDSFISYVSALGLEIALVPVGQAALIQQNLRDRGRLPPQNPVHEPDEDFGPMDLMTRYAYLADPE